MNKHNNNKIELAEENEILKLVDAHTRSGGVSHTSNSADGREYDELFSLLTAAKSSLKPDTALLRKTLAKLPAAAIPLSEQHRHSGAIVSPYVGTVNWLAARVSSWKVATPVIVLFIAVATLVGAAPKRGQAPTVMPVSEEMIAPLAADTAVVPSTFAVAEPAASDASPQMMMMSKMSQTTVPSTTPQNVGELIALLSSEADGDVDLGVGDMNDPLYSVDQASVDALQQSYDVQTI